ncbi:hypothetical protein SDC9_11420 [bioreactor metagenome]|uniref:Uncharacterized protein n=1 Tax=bioreactor metagenome TaxID=1076179 RepID=A0A644TFK9_9ZZZZ|nr:DUF2703 domain-containing protein [Negativicutes bacterium]
MKSNKQKNCCSGEATCEIGCCGQVQAVSDKKKIFIEFMYIDLVTCDRCIGTEASLDEAIRQVSGILTSAGYKFEVFKTLVSTEEQATRLGFVSSPTIRINGRDIELDFKESLCGCCGEIAGEDIDCRVWLWQGKEYTTPPSAMLVDSILRHVYGGQGVSTAVVETKAVPDNLKRFFNSKRKNGR